MSELPDRMPEIRAEKPKSPWPGRIAVAAVVAAALYAGWRFGDDGARLAGRGASAFAQRLMLELKPVLAGAKDRLGPPPADPAAAQPGAAGLSAPKSPARRTAASARPKEAGVPFDQEMRPTLGGPVLLEDHSGGSYWSTPAGKIILVALGLAVFFGLFAWLRGSGRSKTFN